MDFLGTAQRLLTGSPTEADGRTAVSRSYYAVYGVMCSVLRSKIPEGFLRRRFSRRDYVHHKPLRQCLSEGPDEDVKDIAKEFDHLWDARVVADYKLDRTWEIDRASKELGNAADLLDDIDAVGEGKIARHVSSYLQKLPSSGR